MAFGKKEEGIAEIKAPNIVRTTLRIEGSTPYVQLRFSEKAKATMLERMATPAAAKKSRAAREARNYNAEFAASQHVATAGWYGIPAAAFRAAAIDACRTVGLQMTRAKMALFIVPDGFDRDDGTPLVKINASAPPTMLQSLVRNDSGVADVRVRSQWREWGCDLTIEFDADMITASSVANLIDRAGRQVGVGEGRPYSKTSTGQGWGCFNLIGGV